MKVGPQQYVDAHERSQHGLSVVDDLLLSGAELSDGFEVDVSDVLDLDLPSSSLFLDRDTGFRISVVKVDRELVGLLLALGNGVGSKEVFTSIVSTGFVKGLGFGGIEFLLEATKRTTECQY